MRIGMVAERLGVPASTIRYYEKVGLVERQHRISGRRDFDTRSMLVLQFVQLAQAAGFTLAETKALLQSYSSDPGPAGMWQPFAEAKRVSIREQIKRLKQMDRLLTALLSCECETLDACVQLACLPGNVR